MTASGRSSSRTTWGVATIVLIAAGLLVRLVHLGLPIVIIRHGGNIIWGAMVLCLVTAIRPPRLSTVGCLVAASAIAIGTEFFRLYHTPALDAFRLTALGPLLIGRVFSVWNMVDYEIGIVIASLAFFRRTASSGPS